MSTNRRRRLVAALKTWALESNDPDRQVLEFGSAIPMEFATATVNQAISARQLYNEVQEGTALGKWFEMVVDAGAKQASFGEVLQGFGVTD